MTARAPSPVTHIVRLRDVTAADLPIFYEHQRDPDATQMAAFPSRDWDVFMAHWTKISGDATIITQTILVDERVAGNIVSWEQCCEREVGYWIGRNYWGQGVATAALAAFLGLVTARPLYAHVVKHNIASIQVLQKCGFRLCDEGTGLSDTSGREMDEVMLKLDAA